jgi:hypothetical protein
MLEYTKFLSFINMMIIDMDDAETVKALNKRMQPGFVCFTPSRYLVMLKIVLGESAAPYGEYGCVCYTLCIRIEDDGAVIDKDVLMRHFGRTFDNVSEMGKPFTWIFTEDDEQRYKEMHSIRMMEIHNEFGVNLTDETHKGMMRYVSHVVEGSQSFEQLVSVYEKTCLRMFINPRALS